MFKQIKSFLTGLWTSICLCCTFLFLPVVLSGQQVKSATAEKAEQYLSGRGEVIIRFVKPDWVNIEEISFLSIDDVRHDTVTAYANEDGFRQFSLLGIPYEVKQPPSLQQDKFNLRLERTDDWRNLYPSYPGYLELMEGFAADFPGICQIKEFGTSLDNRKLLALKITDNPGINEAEPVVLYSSTIHGDEPLGYVLMLRLIDYLLVNYDTDAQVKRLVDNVEIWINPLANPDGTYFLSDESIAGAKRYNGNNIDLNRDFPKLDDTYWEGTLRQPETIAMMNFMKELQLVLSANFHGGAEVVNYPWDTWPRLHADDAWYRKISRAYADTVHTKGPLGYLTDLENGITNGNAWYTVNGGRQDYANFFLHAREVTIELAADKIPPESSLENYWLFNRQSLLQYIGQSLTGVTGEITDSLTGQPIEANIRIENHDSDSSFVVSSATTGIFYRLTDAGDYPFLITSPGYTAKRVPVRVTEGELTSLNVKLGHIIVQGLYPNPFSSQLTLNIAEPGAELVIEFFDLSGRKAKRITNMVLSSGKLDIPVSGLASGVYIVNITYGNQTFRQVMLRKGL